MNYKEKAGRCRVRKAKIQQLAEEALFQLSCGKEFTGWMVSLMGAIQTDQKYSGGVNSPGLAALGLYLAEGQLIDCEHALDAISAQLAAAGGAQ